MPEIKPAAINKFGLTSLCALLAPGLLTIFIATLTLSVAFAADEKEEEASEEAKEEEEAEAPKNFRYRCEAPLFYLWDSDAVNTKEVEKVFFKNLSAEAESEENAKYSLGNMSNLAEQDAVESCEQSKSSATTCVAGALSRHSTEYRQLDFPARREFLSTVSQDCRSNAGKCTGVELGETRCEPFEIEQENEASKKTRRTNKRK